MIRVVQGESLVGDRQFWITRPYEWPKLLGSKIAFVLVFVCVPLLVLQIVLLRSAGFHPANYVTGLLWMQATLLMFVLPMAALATVTATIVQLLLALLIVVLYLIGMSWLSSQFRNWLLSDQRAAAFVADLEADYERVRAHHASKKATPLVSLAEARANKTPIDWASYAPPAPKFIGRRVLKNQDLAEIAEVIDWGPFFQTWELAGPYPAILNDEIVGESARRSSPTASACCGA